MGRETVRALSAEALAQLHALVIEATGGIDGILDSGKLEAASQRLDAGAGDVELYPTVFAKAAALAHSIARSHPFADGNKRTALLAAVYMLAVNGFLLKAEDQEQEDTVVELATGAIEVDEFAAWLEAHSFPLAGQQ